MSSASRFVLWSLAGSLLPWVAAAQDSEHTWQKSYSVSAKPVLTLETADSNLEVHSCGDCRSVRIHVDSGRKLSNYRLEESQSGDHVSFSLKEKPGLGFHMNWSKSEYSPRVSVETPADLTLEARTGDGNLKLRDVRGDLHVRSGDGNVDIAGTDGLLHLTSGDGNVQIRGAKGSIEARTSDGNLTVDGSFSSVQLHTSDGNLDFALTDGSHLATASRVESSDGHVKIRVPHSLAADLDVTTSDGRIDCSLPLVMDHYNSRGDGHHIHGRLNAGGTPLTVHTSDGNVSIAEI